MIRLEYVPPYKDMLQYYGNPDADADRVPDPAWWSERTTVFELPYSVRGCWNNRLYKHLRFHNLVGPAIVDAMMQFALDVPVVEVMKWNELGDALNIRLMKEGTLLSTHSCGVAIDLNPTIACWQCAPSAQHPALVQAFKDRGFIWGGVWPKKWTDPMHFQAVGL